MKSRIINGKSCELKNGRLYIDGEWKFMKSGKPLRDYGNAAQIDELISHLPIIAKKGYTNLALNCYWHHFDFVGDGTISADIQPLRRLIDAINENGMFASLSVETYGVGGGTLPAGFWKSHPNAVAVDSKGEKASDTEYAYASVVPSLFDEDYLRCSRNFIRNIARALSDKDFLYCETTVEPQYMGARYLDYSASAKKAYEAWCAEKCVNAPEFPKTFPVPDEFVFDVCWNTFRGHWLADWVNGDARAYREGFGDKPVWIASDYLDAAEKTMAARVGSPMNFLLNLTEPDILQVNWSWHFDERRPNAKAYARVREVMAATGRDWAVTEHMTINGTDYFPHEMEALLRNTIANSTNFGWEFVDIAVDNVDPSKEGVVVAGSFKPLNFSVYNNDWTPKPSMAVVDDRWEEWMSEILGD
ncbi:MAG: beta-galactosidase [Opitutales bacterium]|nr:beta-galactosidase [Opitutales bacterium]